MPRKSRLSIRGAITQVMLRSLNGLSLCKDNEDGAFFVEALPRYLITTGCRCYAWTLMTNHYHYTATRKYGATATAVADYPGIHPTAVSAMVCKGKQLAEKKVYKYIIRHRPYVSYVLYVREHTNEALTIATHRCIFKKYTLP